MIKNSLIFTLGFFMTFATQAASDARPIAGWIPGTQNSLEVVKVYSAQFKSTLIHDIPARGNQPAVKQYALEAEIVADLSPQGCNNQFHKRNIVGFVENLDDSPEMTPLSRYRLGFSDLVEGHMIGMGYPCIGLMPLKVSFTLPLTTRSVTADGKVYNFQESKTLEIDLKATMGSTLFYRVIWTSAKDEVTFEAR